MVEEGETSEPAADSNSPNTSKETNSSFASTARHVLGQSLNTIAETANDNVVAVRYAAGSAVLLLGLYSVSQTPLFFRYKSVLDLPSSLFSNRRTLTCRVFHVEKQHHQSKSEGTLQIPPRVQPIIVHARHLSPIGRLLSKQQLDFILKHSPSSIMINKDASLLNDNTLLRLQIDGIVQPEGEKYSQNASWHQQDDILSNLARENALVQCQCLALLSPSDDSPATAIARLYYWQRRESPLLWFFPKKVDLQAALVQSGGARLADHIDSTQDGNSHSQKRLLYASESVKHKHADVQYLEQLTLLERDAIQYRRGMWENNALRDAYNDVVQEVEWEATASWWQKLWRRFTS